MKELAIIIPVYNEEEIINTVISDWIAALRKLNITFDLYLYNDGSTDDTFNTVNNLHSMTPNFHIVNNSNQGHGPTILEAYKSRIHEYQWLFQCDSDNEIAADHFSELWQLRESYDFLIGIREREPINPFRKILSKGSNIVVKFLFGSKIQDVNSPYRLFRSDFFKDVILRIPQKTFAPNVIISGMANTLNARIYSTPVPYTFRKTGTTSVFNRKIASIAFNCFWQSFEYKLKFNFRSLLSDYRRFKNFLKTLPSKQ